MRKPWFHEGAYDYEEAAINRFTAAGGTVVAGAGNNGADLNGFPSDYGNVVSVIATNEDKTRRSTSNFGWECNVCCPGTSIAVPGPGSETWFTNGTSMASPICAGVVAMMYSVNPGINFTTVRDTLQSTATDIGDSGRDYYTAYGLVNAYRVVTAVGGGSTGGNNPQNPPQSSEEPQEVFGLVVESPAKEVIEVVWGANGAMESKGQRYNVYIDGNKVSSGVPCTRYRYENITGGRHTVKVTSVLNGLETGGDSRNIDVEAKQSNPDGFVTAGPNETTLDYWSVYFASGWANDPKGSYRDGHAYDNFGIKISKASGVEWGIQLKTKEIAITEGKNYTCRIVVNSNMATGGLRIKEDKSENLVIKSLAAGDNTIELSFTSKSTALVVFDLGQAPEGLQLEIKGFELIDNTPPAEESKPAVIYNGFERVEAENFDSQQGLVVDPNASASNGKNIGGINPSDFIQFEKISFTENAAGIKIYYSCIDGNSNNRAEIFADGNKVGFAVFEKTGNWSTYTEVTAKLDSEISGGTHQIKLLFTNDSGNGYVCNIDYFQFIKKSEWKDPVLDPASPSVTDALEINGFQISAAKDELRILYSAAGTISGKNAVETGLVYCTAADDFKDEMLYVGSSYGSLKKLTARSGDKFSSPLNSDRSYASAISFAREKTSENFNRTNAVRVYVKFQDGTYAYSKVTRFSIYSIADKYYQKGLMKKNSEYDYLYYEILKVVTPGYVKNSFHEDGDFTDLR